MTHDRSPLYLLSGGACPEARRWLASHADEFPGSETKFLDGELLPKSESQATAAQSLRWRLSVLLAVAILLGIYANGEYALQAIAQTKEAERQTKEAEKRRNKPTRMRTSPKTRPESRTSRQLAASPRRNGTNGWTVRSSWRSKPCRPTPSRHADSLFKALHDQPALRTFLHIEEGGVQSVAFSPDGKTIAAGYGGVAAAAAGWCCGTWPRASAWRTTALPVKEGMVWERGLQPRRQDHRGRIRRLRRRRRRGAVGRGRAQAPGGRATGREGGRCHERGLQPRRQDHRGRIPRHRRPRRGGGVVLWDVAARKRLVDEPLPVKEGNVKSVAFSPDGKTIAAGYGDYRRRRRGAVGRGRAQTPGGRAPGREGGQCWSVAFSPDGKTIAAGYASSAASAGWCCGTWPRANAWRTTPCP